MNSMDLDLGFDYVYTPHSGLGDALSCFNTDQPILASTPMHYVLGQYSSCRLISKPLGRSLRVDDLHFLNFNGMHLFNRVRVWSRLPPLDHPRAILDKLSYLPEKTSIAFSFDVGQQAIKQKRLIHPRARELYPENQALFQTLIDRYHSKLDFIEVGLESFGFHGVRNATGQSLDETIQILRRCHLYIGMHSGMMHLATAIGLTCCIVVNFPESKLFEFTDQVGLENDLEMHWIYPQHQYLHEDDLSGPLAFSLDNLELFLARNHVA